MTQPSQAAITGLQQHRTLGMSGVQEGHQGQEHSPGLIHAML